jgi:hypothetical protein
MFTRDVYEFAAGPNSEVRGEHRRGGMERERAHDEALKAAYADICAEDDSQGDA